jgi:dihydropteroate synthase
MSLPEKDKYSYDRDYILQQISMLFGGRIAEEVFMNQMTTGASNDFERATEMARNMVTRYGMSDALGPMVYAENEGEVFLGRSVTSTKNVSESTMQKVDGEIRRRPDQRHRRRKAAASAEATGGTDRCRSDQRHDRDRRDADRDRAGLIEPPAFETPGSSGRFHLRDPSMSSEPMRLSCGRFTLDLSRPRVMGIVNVTPDSFSDGGLHAIAADAIRHAGRLIEEGADILDIGAESTRPGAGPLEVGDEWARLEPVLAALRDAPVPVSVDTRKPEVMRRSLAAGASMINDVSGFATVDARHAVATSDCGLCVMHMQGEPATMQAAPIYADVVAEVATFLDERAHALVEDGVDAARIVVDPGFGFGKTLEHNLALLRSIDVIARLGWPVLVGLSRKGLIGSLTGRPIDGRLPGSIAAALIAVGRGAAIVRVHDVAETVDALRVWRATQDFRGAADEDSMSRR